MPAANDVVARQNYATARGFTLLELMVAIVLFSMISTAAYKLLTSVTGAHEVTQSILHKLDKQQRAEIIVEQDLLQISGRPITDETVQRPAVQVPGSGTMFMEFTRSGWQNPLQAERSSLQRVAYAHEGSELIRYYWSTLDRISMTPRIRQLLMTEVSSVNVRLLDQDKRWLTRWPHSPLAADQNSLTRLPLAVELTIVHEKMGPMVTIVPLSSYIPTANKSRDANRAKPDQRHPGNGEKRNGD